jgi:hypothetical protein
METINASELSVLLDIDKKSAVKKIVFCLDKNNIWYDIDDTKNVSVSTEILSKHLGVDFNFYIKNIQEKYLTSPTTRGFIFNYPINEKLKLNPKTKTYPKTVSIPRYISQFLTDDQKETIVQEWKDRYNSQKDFINVIFKK